MIARRLAILAVAVLPLTGCARVGSIVTPVPAWTIRFIVKFGGPVSEGSYYFIAIDANNDLGSAGPIPVAAGPWYGNGWGTGAITHYIEYNEGQYNVFRQTFTISVEQTAGGIVAAAGSPTAAKAGAYDLTVGALTLGSVAVSGTGPVTGATNNGDQNAGTFSLATDGAGRTVAGGVTFTPASNGGRAPNGPEQTRLNTLNAGGVLLAPTSLSPFGLTLSIGPPAAGTQTIVVQPTIAPVTARFAPTWGAPPSPSTGTLTANSSTPTTAPPIPGVTITTTTLAPGGVARLRSLPAPSSVLLGPPYQCQLPLGSNQLDVTLDEAMLGASAQNLSVNIITTTQLIFSGVTDRAQHCYDGLGVLGNDFVNFDATQTRTLTNSGSFHPEGNWRSAGPYPRDLTLQGNVMDQQRDSVDIVDWTIMVQRLGG